MERWADRRGDVNVEQTLVHEHAMPSITLAESRYSFRPATEWTDFYTDVELHFVLDRQSVSRVWGPSGSEFRLGKLVLLPPQTLMTARSGRQPSQSHTFSCNLATDWIEEIAEDEINWQACDLRSLLDLQNPHLERSIARLAAETRKTGSTNHRVIDALCMSISIDVAHRLVRAQADKPRAGALPPLLLRRVFDRIHDCSAPLPKPKDLAAANGITLGRLRRGFRLVTGHSLSNVLDQTRMERTCALLTDTAMPLKGISFRVGFEQQSAFSYWFRRIVGESPTEYRQRRQGARTDA